MRRWDIRSWSIAWASLETRSGKRRESSIYGIVVGRSDTKLAETILTPIAELQVEILGSDHPHTLDTLMLLANSMYALRAMNMLSVALRNAGQLADANESLIELLAVISEVLGPTDPWTLRAHYNLADVQRLLGQIDDAEATARQSVRLALTNPDLRAAHVASSYDGLAKALTTKGDHQFAIEAFDTAIELATEEYGQDHAEVINLLTGKAENLIELDIHLRRKLYSTNFNTHLDARQSIPR